MNQSDSCIYYAKKGLEEARTMDYKREISKSSNLLAEEYEVKDPRESLHYLKIAKLANDSLYNPRKALSLEKTFSDEQERRQKSKPKN
jgi:hypothetical protein